jgi:hypothetical protein
MGMAKKSLEGVMSTKNVLIVAKVLLIGLLLGALFPMPYGYFSFLRFYAFGVLVAMAWWSYRNESEEKALLFLLLALLFQPFYKIYLGRFLWNVVDVLVAGIIAWNINPNNSRK